jgi:hypothetical protein
VHYTNSSVETDIETLVQLRLRSEQNRNLAENLRKELKQYLNEFTVL